MASTLTGTSTDAQVWDAYDNSASFEEDSDRSKALAFVTACRILARRLPISASRGGQSISRESLQEEARRATQWLAANPGTSGAGSTRYRYADLSDYRS
jgi:hypothetical protein